jgi:ABC-type multidrug transport system fused ATPase/permease subunit
VTHQIQFAQYADRIVVMDKGKIIEKGKFQELMEAKVILIPRKL